MKARVSSGPRVTKKHSVKRRIEETSGPRFWVARQSRWQHTSPIITSFRSGSRRAGSTAYRTNLSLRFMPRWQRVYRCERCSPNAGVADPAAPTSGLTEDAIPSPLARFPRAAYGETAWTHPLQDARHFRYPAPAAWTGRGHSVSARRATHVGDHADRRGQIAVLPASCSALAGHHGGRFAAHFADEGSDRQAAGSGSFRRDGEQRTHGSGGEARDGADRVSTNRICADHSRMPRRS